MKTQRMKRKALILALTLAFAAGPVAANATTYSGNQTISKNIKVGSGDTWDPTSTQFSGSANPLLAFDTYAGHLSFGPTTMGGSGEIKIGSGSLGLRQLLFDGNTAAKGSGTLTLGFSGNYADSGPATYVQLIGDNPIAARDLIISNKSSTCGGGGCEYFDNLVIGGGQTATTETLNKLDFTAHTPGDITMEWHSTLNVKTLIAANGATIRGWGTVNAATLTSSGSVGFGYTGVDSLTGPAPKQADSGPLRVNVTNATMVGAAIDGNQQSVYFSLNGGTLTMTGGAAGKNNGTLSVGGAAYTPGGSTRAVFSGYGTINGNILVNGASSTANPLAGYVTRFEVAPHGNGLAINGNYTQNYGGDLVIPITPSVAYGIADNGTFSESGNLIVSGENGVYKNGQTYHLITANTLNWNPNGVYYVYNGALASGIGGLKPYLTKSSTNVKLCLGSKCVASKSPSKSKSPKSPSKSTPSVPVHVVTPVQESKPIVADSPRVTQAAIQNTAQNLVSTGVVGGGPRGLWTKAMGGFSSQSGYAGTNYGIISGYGWSVGQSKRDVAGIAFSAGQAGLGTGVSNFVKASDYGLWLYGTYYPLASRQWKIAGTIGGGMSTNTLMSTALGLPQTGHFGGSFMGTEIRASYWKTLNGMDSIIVSPRLSVGYNQSWTSGFSTHGGGPLNVAVSGQSNGQLYLEPAILVGKKFNYHSQSGNHTIFPQVRFGAVENVGPNPSASISSGQVAGQVQGLAYPHTQGMVEARLDVISHTRFSKGLAVNVSARELFGNGAQSMEGIAAVKYRW
jgi:hypothetical protein